MTDHDVHGCGRAGAWMGVLCAAVGVLAAGLMVWALGIGWAIGLPMLPIEVVIALTALFIGASYFGKKAGVFLCKRGNRLSTNVLIGIALAFGSIAIAVWAGTIVGILHELPRHDFLGVGTMFVGLLFGWLFFLVVILMYGGIPAALLGVTYGSLMRRQLRKVRP